MNYRIHVALLTSLLACGGNKKDAPKAKDDASVSGPTVAPITTPPIGVDAIKRMNFAYGDGRHEFEKAQEKQKAGAWPQVKQYCEATLAKDPNHLDAHRLIATALAQTGEHAAAVDHLVTALAGDYLRYADFAKDDNLKPFLDTPHGTAIKEVAEKIRAELVRRAASGVLVIGRRSGFKWPKDGIQYGTSRGELYAFDRETHRYLRLTHTEHQVAAFVRSPSGNEVAVFGFDKIDRPKGDDATPLVNRSWLQVMDTKDWSAIGPRVQLGGGREVHIGYGAGDQLLVATAPAAGRWGIGELAVSSLDKASGKLTKVKAELPTPRIAFSLEEGRIVRGPAGITGTFAGDPPTTPTIALAGADPKSPGGATIHVPESGAAAESTIALSPDKARVAFATWVDPCSKDTAPSLYVADTKTGTLKHLLTSKSRFVTRWIDPTTLAYEDGDGAVRLWDATSGREAYKIDNKVGIALEVLSLAPAPLCKGAPPTVDVGTGSGGDEPPPMPPEEGAGSAAGSDGPVTKPN